jgi:tRNA A58 N-methylase Trm61
VELLKALHILTRDGALNQDSRRKLKQVQHLVQLVTPQLTNVKTIADLGAGKSYLGFMLYDLWMREKSETHLWAIEQRPELVATCRRLAKDSGFDRISFVAQSILEASSSTEVPKEVDAVTALHACDTATDEAIAFALRKKAKVIALVPCCQAEVARLLPSLPPEGTRELKSLWSHNLHRREFGSHLTNVIRTL